MRGLVCYCVRVLGNIIQGPSSTCNTYYIYVYFIRKLKMAQKRDEFLDDLRRTAAIDFKEMAGVACLKKEMNF